MLSQFLLLTLRPFDQNCSITGVFWGAYIANEVS